MHRDARLLSRANGNPSHKRYVNESLARMHYCATVDSDHRELYEHTIHECVYVRAFE